MPTHLKRILIAFVFASLSACGYIKSLFPDKEKDYQYTTEIAPLKIPPGLTDNPVFQQAASSSGDTSKARTAQSEETAAEEIPASFCLEDFAKLVTMLIERGCLVVEGSIELSRN